MSDSDERDFKVDTIVLSKEQRDQIMPSDVKIPGKRYQMPENWTYYMARIIWDSGVRNDCAYSFLNGNIIENELKTIGTCKECGGSFNISSKQNFRKIILVWKHLGSEEIVHFKKRTITKTLRKNIANELMVTSSTVYRRQEAAKYMKPWDKTPAFIANAGEFIILYLLK